MADVNFGYEDKGPYGRSMNDTIEGSFFTTGATGGTATSITCWVEESYDLAEAVGFAIYKQSDKSLIGYTETWNMTESYANWKTLDIAWGGTLEASTTYCLVCHAEATWIKLWYNVGGTSGYQSLQNKWPNPWDPVLSGQSKKYSIYCSYTEGAAGTNIKINIGDTFKDVSEMKINVGDTWKTVAEVKQNVGDAWKTVF